MNLPAPRLTFLCRFLEQYVRNSRRQISCSSLCFVRQKTVFARREIDFLQPISKISSPLTVCVLKNYFVTFGFAEQSEVGKAIQVVEYHLDGAIKARLIFTVAELRELYDSMNSQKSALVEGQETTIEVDKSNIRIWEDTDCGLRVLRVSHSTPFYNSLRALVVPIFNLEEFLNKMNAVLTNEKLLV